MSVKPPSNRILIAMLYWDGDRAQALKLAKLLADLEKEHSTLADFLFVSRFDCKHCPDTIQYVARKFNVFKHTSKRQGTGWPRGCNSLFFGMLEWVYHKMSMGQIPNYKAVFIMGPDGAPIKRDWIKHLSGAWDAANKEKKIYTAGALLPAAGRDHINGDAMMISSDLAFLKWLTIDVRDIKGAAGWDWILAPDFQRWGWRNFPFVRSLWRRQPPFTQEDWNAENTHGTVWLHGVKEDDLMDLSRKNLL